MHAINRKTITITVLAATAVFGGGYAASAAVRAAAPATTVNGCIVGTSRVMENAFTNSQPDCGTSTPFSLAKGATGAQGPAGSPGLASVQADEPYGQDVDPNANVTQSDGAIAAGTTAVVWVACPSGKTAIGGGFRIGNGQSADAAESDSTAATYSGSDVQVLASESTYETGGKLSLASAPQVTSYGSYLPNAWAVTVHNGGTATAYARSNVICADTAS